MVAVNCDTLTEQTRATPSQDRESKEPRQCDRGFLLFLQAEWDW